MENIKIWDKVKNPPGWALKTITGGRMNGKTDINPQWRYKALTELFGACGIGWYYTIDRLWTETGSDGQVMAMANVSLFVNKAGEWSNPIQGTGGNMIIKKEGKDTLFTSDEGYKMAVTDALSVACKMLGIGAEIYQGTFDSKYQKPEKPAEKDPATEAIRKELLTYADTPEKKAWVNGNRTKIELEVKLAEQKLHAATNKLADAAFEGAK